ncbi:MAG: hypothetical protein ACRYFZ_18060 [Janthinobacterium lividum]
MSASSSVGQRFSLLIQQLGMSKNAFAMSLDKTATVIQHLVDERNKPGFDLMNKVFEVYPNVSVDWLVRGHGPMLRDIETLNAPVALAAQPVAVPAASTPPRVAPATPSFPAPLFSVSAASQPSLEVPTPIAEPLAAPPVVAANVPPPAASQPIPTPAETPPEPSPLAPPAPTATPPAAPDAAYLTAALHAQYLQHQLALAEQRNQHLVEQQQLMQQMLTMLQSR